LNRNFVFLHIPKAAGSAVRRLFRELFGDDQVYPERALHHFPEFRTVAAAGPKAYLSHLGYRFAVEADAITATVLRDPLERVLSIYSYSVHPGRGVPLLPDIDPEMSLLEFIRSDRPEIRMNIDEAQTWQIGYGYSTDERARFGRKHGTDILDAALANLGKIDLVGVTEGLDAFGATVASFFGTEQRSGMPVVNASERRKRSESLTPEERGEIEALIRQDRVLYDAATRLATRHNATLQGSVEPTLGPRHGLGIDTQPPLESRRRRARYTQDL
jgi:hypothetical protein